MENICFVSEVNTPTEGVYDLFFTDNPNSVWGENWNICPAGIVGGLEVDKGYLSSAIRIKVDIPLELAQKNSCFSMQDCIDGIFPLAYNSLDETSEPLYFMFNEEKDKVKKKLAEKNISVIKDWVIRESDDPDSSIIDIVGGDNDIDDFDF